MTFFQRNTPKYSRLYTSFGQSKFALLDIGAGNHSASKYKSAFPNCEYHGVDLEKTYNNDENDFKVMTAFYEMDLTKLDFTSIPNDYFDFVMMAHIIEHLHNGDEVIRHLTQKLKSGGRIYIEYPGINSTKLPSMKGTLNFYDDKTHVRVFSIKEVIECLGGNFRILESGTRRNLAFLAAMPVKILLNLAKLKKPTGDMFWDLLGFAEFVYAEKK